MRAFCWKTSGIVRINRAAQRNAGEIKKRQFFKVLQTCSKLKFFKVETTKQNSTQIKTQGKSSNLQINKSKLNNEV